MKEGEAKRVDDFLHLCHYRKGSSYGDSEGIQNILTETNCQNILIYLAIPPHVFSDSTGAVMKAREALPQGNGFFRVVLEKPFGNDSESCDELLQSLVDQKWPEEELYRIDHYLGKEMVQNILTLRQHNPWIGALWNKDVIQSVHLIWKEDIGTEGRGGYFDPYGIIRDILQNHLLQVLTLLAMEPPAGEWTSDEIRNAKVNVLKAMPTIELKDCLLGQYDGYKDDPTIENRETVSPTYACIQTKVNTPRWEGVPFVMEAGKALNERVCEVRLHFRGSTDVSQPNCLVIRLQPTPKVFFTANLKTPGFSSTPTSTHLGVDYDSHLHDIPDAYTRLLLDVLRAQQENFVRNDELIEAWRVFTPVLHETEKNRVEPLPYGRGTNGPELRQDFLNRMGVTQPWLPPASAL
uniref:glucose-6-phosphate dehydrogenase (NADP(+)) n=1 Tax=Entomoneis paludosa TaxID=265537 RepID=A0A7S2VDX1_9STRA|mmetsp:Transcript_16203/g.33521  ORF Transcript_16203/g.33521 Transcript_16203/m.33521 type:complete len:407 (+) Transcript_16203:223-1443(+)